MPKSLSLPACGDAMEEGQPFILMLQLSSYLFLAGSLAALSAPAILNLHPVPGR